MPEAILPVRCTFRIKTGASYGQEGSGMRGVQEFHLIA
jgi:hypothetical protein